MKGKYNKLGNAVRVYRKLRGFKQVDVARRAGISQGYLTLIETGARRNVGPEILDALSKALKLDESARESIYVYAGYARKPLYVHESYAVPDRRNTKNRRDYPYLFDVLTSGSKNVVLEDFSAAVFEAIRLVESKISGPKRKKKDLLEMLLIKAIMDMHKKK